MGGGSSLAGGTTLGRACGAGIFTFAKSPCIFGFFDPISYRLCAERRRFLVDGVTIHDLVGIVGSNSDGNISHIGVAV